MACASRVSHSAVYDRLVSLAKEEGICDENDVTMTKSENTHEVLVYIRKQVEDEAVNRLKRVIETEYSSFIFHIETRDSSFFKELRAQSSDLEEKSINSDGDANMMPKKQKHNTELAESPPSTNAEAVRVGRSRFQEEQEEIRKMVKRLVSEEGKDFHIVRDEASKDLIKVCTKSGSLMDKEAELLSLVQKRFPSAPPRVKIVHLSGNSPIVEYLPYSKHKNN